MFELACPWVFIILPLPLFIWFLVSPAPLQLPVALKVPFFKELVAAIEGGNNKKIKQIKPTLLFVSWFFLVLALAGPRWVGQPQPVSREGFNIMLALDISESMALHDMVVQRQAVSRLAVVKHAAQQFVQARTGDKIGLILFASRAYLQTPLTFDRQNVLMRIEDATVGLAGQTTALGDALGLAVKRLQNVPAAGRIVILLTDGVNNSGVLAPLKAAELAKDDKIKVYTIGLGAKVDPRAANPLFLNFNGTADLDENTLTEIAKMTGGRYFRATDMDSLQSIYHTIDALETSKQEQEMVRPQHDYYPWPLAVALFLFLYFLAKKGNSVAQLNFRRRGRSSQ